MSLFYTLLVVAVLFGLVYWIRNRGREKVVKTDHEYFSRLWLWPKGEHTRWEAELDMESPYMSDVVGLHAEDNYEELELPDPSEKEIAFSKKYLFDPTLLFRIAESGIREGWREWFHEELIEKWESEFKVDGISVPRNGQVDNPWGITFYCGKAGHFFNIALENGEAKLESIDG